MIQKCGVDRCEPHGSGTRVQELNEPFEDQPWGQWTSGQALFLSGYMDAVAGWPGPAAAGRWADEENSRVIPEDGEEGSCTSVASWSCTCQSG